MSTEKRDNIIWGMAIVTTGAPLMWALLWVLINAFTGRLI